MTVATLVVATREVKGVHPAERRTTPPDNGGVRFTAARRGDGFEAAWLGPTEIDRNIYIHHMSHTSYTGRSGGPTWKGQWFRTLTYPPVMTHITMRKSSISMAIFNSYVCLPEVHIPSGNQTWRAGLWTIEISDFPSWKPPLMGFSSTPCLITRGSFQYFMKIVPYFHVTCHCDLIL